MVVFRIGHAGMGLETNPPTSDVSWMPGTAVGCLEYGDVKGVVSKLPTGRWRVRI